MQTLQRIIVPPQYKDKSLNDHAKIVDIFITKVAIVD